MITLEEAQRKYQMWSNAEDTLAMGGKSYSIAGRQLTRADGQFIKEQMEYWSIKIQELSNNRINSIEIIPREF